MKLMMKITIQKKKEMIVMIIIFFKLILIPTNFTVKNIHIVHIKIKNTVKNANGMIKRRKKMLFQIIKLKENILIN
jgi:hypothetical protein